MKVCPERKANEANTCKYILSIVDDYSRKLWIYIQNSKDEAFENFRNWKVLVENQTG